MKINCPICKEQIDETHCGTDLGMHLYWKHKPNDDKDAGDVYRYYAVLIFKIHKEIDRLEYAKKKDILWYYDLTIGEHKTKLETLKYLLEKES